MQGARKGSHNYSILQGKSKRCYFTDTETGPLERHHIYFGVGMRQISDKHGFWVWLKPEWHRGTSGVHGRDGHKIDLRLTSDPKMDWTRSEDSKQYATYTLAVNRRFKKNGQADTDFISCIAWGAMAEFAEKFMKKGAMFAVEGRLNVRSWDDAEGKKHWTTTVVVENCYFTGSKRDAESKPAPEQNRPAAASNKPAKQMGLAEQEGFYPIDESVEDDDLPF